MPLSFEFSSVIIGALAGLLIGATGVGGAAFATPAMVLILGVSAPLAIATDALFVLAIKLVAVWAHRKELVSSRPIFVRVLSGSLPGVGLGVLALGQLRGFEEGELLLKKALGVLLIMTATVSVGRAIWGGRDVVPFVPGWLLLPVSLILGFFVGLTSIGAGSLFLPLLLASVAQPFRSVVALDLSLGLIMAVALAGLHLTFSTIDPQLLLGLVIGGVPGALFGARLHDYLGTKALISTAGGLVAVAGLRLVL